MAHNRSDTPPLLSKATPATPSKLVVGDKVRKLRTRIPLLPLSRLHSITSKVWLIMKPVRTDVTSCSARRVPSVFPSERCRAFSIAFARSMEKVARANHAVNANDTEARRVQRRVFQCLLNALLISLVWPERYDFRELRLLERDFLSRGGSVRRECCSELKAGGA